MRRVLGARTVAAGVLLAVAVASLGAPASTAVVGSPDASVGGSAVRIDIGTDEASNRMCSGALVSPGWVLTAASCFAEDPAAGHAVPAGSPPQPTVATIGRADLTTTDGVVRKVVEIVPHESRDLLLARLALPVDGVDPVRVGATAPAAGDALRVAGYGRTATEWSPLHRHAGGFTLDSVTGGDLAFTGVDGATVCAGDAGAPVLRAAGDGVEAVGVVTRSWQSGCFGADPAETRTGGVASVVTDAGAWVADTVATHLPTATWAEWYPKDGDNRTRPSVAVSRTGYTAMVWQDDRGSNPADTCGTNVYLQLYKDGRYVYSRPVSQDGSGCWRHIHPDVAVRDDGSVVVTYAEDADGDGVYKTRLSTFTAAGAWVSNALVEGDRAGTQDHAKVAVDPNGTAFAIAFDTWTDSSSRSVRLAYYGNSTTRSWIGQPYNGTGLLNQNPDVAMDGAGNVIATWASDNDRDGNFDIRLRKYSPGLVTLLERGVPATQEPNQVSATVAANFAGDFVVGWEVDTDDGGHQIGVRSFSAAHVAGTEVVYPGLAHQVGIDDRRNAAVAWRGGGHVFVRGFNPDGTTTGRLPALTATTTADPNVDVQPTLAVDPSGAITLAHVRTAGTAGFRSVQLGTGLVNSAW